MDLHIHGPEPTQAERASVDAALAESAGKAGEPLADRRDLLLLALRAVHSRFGWLPQGALNYICRRLQVPPAEAYGVATFYHLFSVTPQPPTMVHVCDDIVCRLNGGESICQELEQQSQVPQVGWKRSPCLGQCERAPAALVVQAGESPKEFAVPRVTADVTSTNFPAPMENDRLESLRRSVPQLGDGGLRLLRRIGRVNPESLQDYRASGGQEALQRAFQFGPENVLREVIASRLVGRGGAAFPTGRKWEAVAKAAAMPHYLVCNADESEPGTFKDRLLMEGDPFAILEGMTIAAFATGCEKGFIYIRGEYPLAGQRLATAIIASRAAGLLGSDVLGSGFRFDVEIRRGAGAYICGEETALFNSIEGKRGEPRNKPPFPVESGLFGKPTVINNVETFANVPHIVLEGGAAYASTGTGGSSGPKLFCVSGHVVRPGVYEVAMGLTLRQMIDLAGGVRPHPALPLAQGEGAVGGTVRAVLLGGAAGAFVGPGKLDMPLNFEATRAAGVSLGSGAIIVLDDTVNLGEILSRIAAFFRHESCGQCVPCRVGTVRQQELLQRLSSGQFIGSRRQELQLLREIGQAMRDASICGLGQTASSAIESAIPLWQSTPESEGSS